MKTQSIEMYLSNTFEELHNYLKNLIKQGTKIVSVSTQKEHSDTEGTYYATIIIKEDY